MFEEDKLLSKKNVINLLLLGILVLGIPIGIDLVRTQQILRSKATSEPIQFVGPNVQTRVGQLVATSPQVGIILTSPLGPSASTSATIASDRDLKEGLIPQAYAGHECPERTTYCNETDTEVWHDLCEPEYGHEVHTRCWEIGQVCSRGQCIDPPTPPAPPTTAPTPGPTSAPTTGPTTAPTTAPPAPTQPEPGGGTGAPACRRTLQRTCVGPNGQVGSYWCTEPTNCTGDRGCWDAPTGGNKISECQEAAVTNSTCTARQNCSGLTCTFTHTYSINGVAQPTGAYRVILYPDSTNRSVNTGFKGGGDELRHTYTPGTYQAALRAEHNRGTGAIECQTERFSLATGGLPAGSSCYVCDQNVLRLSGNQDDCTATTPDCPRLTSQGNFCKGASNYLDNPSNRTCGTITPTRPPTVPPTVPPTSPPQVKTLSFKISNSPNGLLTAPPIPYTSHPMVINHDFTVLEGPNPRGQKFVWVEFITINGQTDRKNASITLVGPDPTLSSVTCSLDLTGNNIRVALAGTEFGATQGQGAVLSGSSNLEILDWSDQRVVALFRNPPAGGDSSRNYPITIRRSDGQAAQGQCRVGISQISLGAKVFCRAPSQHSTSNVEITIAEGATGGKKTKEQVSIDKDGVIRGLTTKLEEGKGYKLGIKAPKSVRRVVEFVASAGTTVIPNLILPVGDIFPIDGGDGKINSADFSELKRQFVTAISVTSRTADFNQDGRVNSIDYACMRQDFNAESQAEPQAGPIATETQRSGMQITYDLQTGWNAIGVSVNTTVTPAQLLQDTAGQCTEIQGFNPAAGQAEMYTSDPARAILNSLTQIVGGKGYLIKCSSPTTLTLIGPGITTMPTLNLGNVQFVSLPRGQTMTAQEFLQAVSTNTLNCTEVDRFVSGGWGDRHLKNQSAVNNFQMNDHEGYNVKCIAAVASPTTSSSNCQDLSDKMNRSGFNFCGKLADDKLVDLNKPLC